MQHVAVSAQAISAYEMGKNTPSPEVLRGLASALNVPEHFFLLPTDDFPRGTIFYRSMASATKTARRRAERRFTWLRRIVRYVSEYVELPNSNFPRLAISNASQISSDEIEQAATDVRNYWNLGDLPIANVALLLENQGAVLARDRLGADTLDGLSEFVAEDGRPYMIVGTDKGSPVRWRFDLAHELGHMTLHGEVPRERFARPEENSLIERQAHQFAAAFLLPLEPFGDDLFSANLDTFVALKPKWKVSIAMMIKRAHDAGFISDDAARRLWINLSRRGWRREEPYDATMEPEEPRLLRRSLELILQAGTQTTDDVITRLALPLTDVEALCCMPPGYLSNFAPVSLRPDRATLGDVIQLPLRPRTV